MMYVDGMGRARFLYLNIVFDGASFFTILRSSTLIDSYCARLSLGHNVQSMLCSSSPFIGYNPNIKRDMWDGLAPPSSRHSQLELSHIQGQYRTKDTYLDK